MGFTQRTSSFFILIQCLFGSRAGLQCHLHKFISHILAGRLVIYRNVLGNSQQTNPGKDCMDIPILIQKKTSVATSEIHITSFTFSVMSQEVGREEQEDKYKIPIYLNVVN